MLEIKYSKYSLGVNTMLADALALKFASAPAGMVLAV